MGVLDGERTSNVSNFRFLLDTGVLGFAFLIGDGEGIERPFADNNAVLSLPFVVDFVGVVGTPRLQLTAGLALARGVLFSASGPGDTGEAASRALRFRFDLDDVGGRRSE